MTGKERVLAVLNGEKPDRVPIGLWLHFPESAFFGQQAIKTHLKFFDETGIDLCKVMNESLYPCDYSIYSATDWKNVKIYHKDAAFIQKEKRIIEGVLEAVPDRCVIATVHGVVASASHTLLGLSKYDKIGKYAQLYHIRSYKEPILSAYQKIAETLCNMVEEFVSAGVDGIYYAALGGEEGAFTDEEHERWIAPLDSMVIEAAYNAGAKFVILHMCKSGVRLKRFLKYPCDVVNWGEEESGVSLERGREIFDGKTILGGLNNQHGPLLTGTYEELKEEVQRLIQMHGSKKFIIGSDCTLPSELSFERVAWVSRAVKECEKI